MIDTVLITFENTEILNVPVAKSVARTTAQITSTMIIFVMKERFLSSGSGSSGSIPILPKNGLYVTAYTTIPRNARTAHAANATWYPSLLCDCTGKYRSFCTNVGNYVRNRVSAVTSSIGFIIEFSKKSIQTSATEHRSDCQTSHSDSIARNAKW